VEGAHQTVPPGVRPLRGVRSPDLGEGHLAQERHVLDHAHDAEAVAAEFDGAAGRGRGTEEALARRPVDHRHVVGGRDLLRREWPALEKRERENLPELAVGAFQIRTDLLAVAPRIDDVRVRVERERLDTGKLARVPVEELEPGRAAPRIDAAVRMSAEQERLRRHERSILTRLGRHRRPAVVHDRGRDHEYEQREADPDDADEGEERPAEQHLHREPQVVAQHQCTCRPSKMRTMRSVCSAFA
jgi:hypothetical protein